jgi:tRNA-uridine 2-sulfurtransferase
VPDGNYSRFVEDYARKEMGKSADDRALAPGEITSPDGSVIGEHAGLHRYTIGQRRGIGIASPDPLYVVKIDVPRNRLVVGKRSEIYSGSFVATGVNWLSMATPEGSIRAKVRIRYRSPEAPATITPIETNRVSVEFDEPQAAVTPGQAAVFYDGDIVVGGGWIR